MMKTNKGCRLAAKEKTLLAPRHSNNGNEVNVVQVITSSQWFDIKMTKNALKVRLKQQTPQRRRILVFKISSVNCLLGFLLGI